MYRKAVIYFLRQIAILVFVSPMTCSCWAQSTTRPISLNKQGIPPEWALLERHLLDQIYPAALEFVEKYTNPDGTLKWREEWPGIDGSDDGYESFYNFSLYSALGGPMELDSLARHLWDGVTRQFTKYGQVRDEFDAGYDWMHHGESYTYFYFFGLTNPFDQKSKQRAIKFANLYMDPVFGNYDPELKIIRSPLTGSQGPRFVNTAEDWVTHRPILADYLLPYEDIDGVDSSSLWNDDAKFPLILNALNERMMKGDVPLNLAATSMILNAFMYTGEEKYATWVKDYVGGWLQRVRENDGFLPDNVGLSGKVGENMNGNKWGGYYGWRWPHGLMNQMEATYIGASNAYLVSGDSTYLELPKSVIKLVEDQAKNDDGLQLVPHRFDDKGWWDFRPMAPKYPAHLWFMSRQTGDWQRAKRLADPEKWSYHKYLNRGSHLVRGMQIIENQQFAYIKGKGDSENTIAWMGFLEGENPTYPVDVLKATYGEVLKRLKELRADNSLPDDQDVHHFFQKNPVVLEGLVQLMLGAPNHIYHGGLLHTSLRYFDPVQKRPGIPRDVAALVERITPNSVTLKLVNLHPTESRKVIIQGGMFGEHKIKRVRQVIDYPFQFYTVDKKYVEVDLGPGASGQLELDIERFAHLPSYAFPWHPVR
ncbi:MAG: hypothetical protein IPL46_23010 [Saprospiraceae bacterium]|nr:hypothetical protein [Saprospiraceae bacterium]